MFGLISLGIGAIKGAIGLVSSLAGSVGNMLATGATKLLEFQAALEPITKTIDNVAIINKILTPKENLEELGDKVIKSNKKLEDFNSVNSYIDYLRHKIHSSKEELEKLSPEEILARLSIGAALTSKAIEEKKSLEIPVEFWKEAVNLGLSAKEIDKFLTKFKQTGVKPEEFLKYLKRELNTNEEEKVESALVDAYKELAPQKDIKQIEEEILRMQKR